MRTMQANVSCTEPRLRWESRTSRSAKGGRACIECARGPPSWLGRHFP